MVGDYEPSPQCIDYIINNHGSEVNIQYEKQQKLDVYANEKFIKTLINRNIVCGIASEEEDSFIFN